MSDAVQPIIIKRKKAGHGGHHGGAWKVAYADFVTAMMALFIVLWLLTSSEQTKKAVGGYFQDPTGSGRQVGTGLAGVGESLSITKQDMSKLKDKLDEAVRSMPEIQKIQNQVKITVTGEGLRIELLESALGTFFESGSPRPSENCISLLKTLAHELGKMKNPIVVEGHTDAKPFGTDNSYTNWELSADRANAARRVMEINGLVDGQITQVRGFADQQPFKKADPFDPSNRRITIILQYSKPPVSEGQPAGSKPAEKSAEKPAGKSAEKPAEKPAGAAAANGQHH